MYKEMKNISGTFRRYRFYYKLTDFILFFLIFYTLSYFFNAISFFHRYAEHYVVDAVSLDAVVVLCMSALISGLLVVIVYLRTAPVNPIGMIESRYDWMKEKLQTAWDNRDEENIIIDELRRQVTSCLNQIDVGSFLDRKRLALRLLLSVVLIVSMVGLTETQTRVDITPETIDQIMEDVRANLPENIIPPEDGTRQNGLSEDVYGESSVASIAGENVEVTIISGLGTSVTIRHTEPGEEVQFVPSQTYPVDIIASAAADESYQVLMQLSPEDRNLIKDYAVLRSKLQ